MKVDEKIISEDEAALYDRQIRLWGVDAQKKLLSARILLIKMQGLGAEVAKNLVLSGINTLTLLDSKIVDEKDLKFNFLLPHSNVGKNRAESCLEALQTLNPMVKVHADIETLEQKDSSYFSKDNYDIVCMLSDDLTQLEIVNNHCRNNDVLFLSGYVHGLFGYMFVDFNNYQFIVEAPKISEDNFDKKKPGMTGCPMPSAENNQKTDEKKVFQEKSLIFKSFRSFLNEYTKPIENLSANKMKRISKTYFIFLLFKTFAEEYKRPYCPSNEEDKVNILKVKKTLFESMKLDDKLLTDDYLTEQSFDEFSPVNAILGGVVAQEIIKAISGKNEPIENFFLFDGDLMSGEVVKI